jgi:hypothetical protein
VPTVVACTGTPTSSCASFLDTSGTKQEVWLADKTLYLTDADFMGSFTLDSGLHVLAYVDTTSPATLRSNAQDKLVIKQ